MSCPEHLCLVVDRVDICHFLHFPMYGVGGGDAGGK